MSAVIRKDTRGRAEMRRKESGKNEGEKEEGKGGAVAYRGQEKYELLLQSHIWEYVRGGEGGGTWQRSGVTEKTL